MPERNAIVIASDKRNVTDLAEGLYRAGYNVVSRGRTADLLNERTEIPIQPVEQFLGSVGLPDVSVLPDRSQREIISSYLKQSLSLHRDRLEDLGWPILDFAYVNLVPAEAKQSTMGDHMFLAKDDSGKSIINGAISGLRPVMMAPEQICFATDILSKVGPQGIEHPYVVDDLSKQAIKALGIYDYYAGIAAPTGVSIGGFPDITPEI